MTRLALFALFAGALLLVRAALTERRAIGQDRARALFQAGPDAPGSQARGQGTGR